MAWLFFPLDHFSYDIGVTHMAPVCPTNRLTEVHVAPLRLAGWGCVQTFAASSHAVRVESASVP